MADSEASKSSALLCPCGAGVCPLLTSSTQKNPGRQFYRCPANRCRFFKWLDQVESHQLIDVPLCACGAGICRIEAEASGPNAGRKFFVCPIKKGQGACNYFLWQDADENVATSYTEDEPSILTVCTGTRPSKNNQVEEGEPTNLGREIHSFTAETLQFSKDLVSTSSPLKRNKILEELKGSKDKSDEPSRKHSKSPVRHTASESRGIPFGSSFERQALLPNLEYSLNEEPTQDSFQAVKIKLDEKTNEFKIQNSFQETVLTAACSFSSTYSDSSMLPTNLEVLLGTGTRPSKNNQVEEGETTNLGGEIHSFTADTSQFSKDPGSTSSPLKRNKVLEEFKGSKDKSDEPSRKHSKRVRHTASESHGIPFGSSFEGQALLPNLEYSLNEEPTQYSFQALTIKVDEKTNAFRVQSSFQETVLTAACSFSSTYSDSSTLPTNLEVLLGRCLVVSMIHQEIHVQFHGWLGRLAFCPPRSLMEPVPKPFFCCVFPSFDPISVSKNASLCDDHVPAYSLGSSFGAETYSQPLTTENQCPLLLHPQRNSIMTKSVSKAFSRAAEQLQIDLLTLLKSMDIEDYETMSQEANATFAALDQLCIDHQKFSGQVKELIRCASLLAKIDQSISNDHSCELLVDRFNSEKMKLHEIDDAFLASKRRLMLLSEEVSHLKDKLSQIEADLCCCQAENLELKAQMVQIAEAKGKAWETLQTAFKELKSAYRLRELREAERSAAMAAFGKAKLVLWG